MKVQAGQSLFDVAVALGDASLAWQLARANNLAITHTFETESEINTLGMSLVQEMNFATGLMIEQIGWILATGSWNDDAVWMNDKVWID